LRRLILILTLLSACRSSPSPAPFKERVLGRVPEGFELVPPVAFSRDGREAAFIIKSPEGCRVVRGSWKSRRLDAL